MRLFYNPVEALKMGMEELEGILALADKLDAPIMRQVKCSLGCMSLIVAAAILQPRYPRMLLCCGS